MIAMPVSSSPFSRASWIGDAPLYFGSRDGWMLMHPCLAKFNKLFGINSPYATTIITSGLSFLIVSISVLSIFSGCRVFSPSSFAAVLTGGGVITPLFPGLSGWVTTACILNSLLLASIFSVGTANSGVPKK